MTNVTTRTFVLTKEVDALNGSNEAIEATANSWNDMRDYCSETGKRGNVYVITTNIPLGGSVWNSAVDVRWFGKI